MSQQFTSKDCRRPPAVSEELLALERETQRCLLAPVQEAIEKMTVKVIEHEGKS